MIYNHSDKIKYLGVNWTNMYGIYIEIYEMMKEIKEDWNKLRDKACSWVRRLNIVKMLILSKFLLKSQQAVFNRYRQAYSKIFM